MKKVRCVHAFTINAVHHHYCFFSQLLNETGLRETDFRLKETMGKFNQIIQRQLRDENELRGYVDKATFER